MKFQTFLFRKHLEAGEEVYFVAHKHWIVILPDLAKIIIFFTILPWVLWMLFPPFFWVAVLWTIAGVGKLIYCLTDWYLDAWLTTSLSIIDLEWKGIFQYTSTRVEYPAIEGVSYQITGFLGTVLSFGDTQIDRVSNSNPIKLEKATNPKYIEMKILECKNRFEETKNQVDSDGLKDILANMVAFHVKKNGWQQSQKTFSPELKKVQL